MNDTPPDQPPIEGEREREPSRCENCTAPLHGPFCAQCGQEDRPAVVPMGVWLRDATSDLLQLDVRLFTTLGLLLRQPGELTRRYLAGRWSEQTPPLRLYLIVSAVSIAAMSFFGILQIDAVLRDAQTEDLEALRTFFGVEDPHDPLFQARFNRRLNTVFPIFNLITPFALSLALKLVYRRRLMQEHLVFALHYSAAFVAYGSVAVPVFPYAPPSLQLALAVAMFVGMLGYLLLAMKHHYGDGWRQLLWRMALVYLCLLVIAQVISGLSFWLVLQTI